MKVYGAEFFGTLRLFWVAPIVGVALKGLIHRFLSSDKA
jgi:hypothetical protein